MKNISQTTLSGRGALPSPPVVMMLLPVRTTLFSGKTRKVASTWGRKARTVWGECRFQMQLQLLQEPPCLKIYKNSTKNRIWWNINTHLLRVWMGLKYLAILTLPHVAGWNGSCPNRAKENVCTGGFTQICTDLVITKMDISNLWTGETVQTRDKCNQHFLNK